MKLIQLNLNLSNLTTKNYQTLSIVLVIEYYQLMISVSQFSNAGGSESELFVDAHDYNLLDGYSRFLVQGY